MHFNMSPAVVHGLMLLGCSRTHFFPFSFLINDSGHSLENHVYFSSRNYHWGSARPVSLLDSPSETCLYFDFTSCMWFAEMGCWGFPPVHDSKFLFPHFDCQFYIWSKFCFSPGFLGKQFVKAAALCPSGSPVWIFDCTPWLLPNLTEKQKTQNEGKPHKKNVKNKFMKMNDQLMERGFLCLCVSSCLYV